MSANNQLLIGEVPSISIPVLVCVCAEVGLRVLIKSRVIEVSVLECFMTAPFQLRSAPQATPRLRQLAKL